MFHIRGDRVVLAIFHIHQPITHIILMRDLLFEIGMEEIPAGFLQPALVQLQDRFTAKAAELKFGHGSVKVMGTPRRLALIVNDVEEKQKDTLEELLGPATAARTSAEPDPGVVLSQIDAMGE
jgi:glycyl-tRNA synthetase beta chain